MQTAISTKKGVNIAPSSDNGHFIQKARKVVNLDEVNETFKVEGGSVMTTKNHTDLKTDEDCLVTCQTVYDPFTGAFNKSKD